MVRWRPDQKYKETYPNVVIDINPVIVDILPESSFVTEITNLLPLIHRAARLEHGQRGAAHDDDQITGSPDLTTSLNDRPPHTVVSNFFSLKYC